MGNVLNTAINDSDNLVLVDAILPYDNLSISEIEAYWRSFYDHASSFALTRNQFQVVCSHASCMIDRHASTKKSIENADKVFDVFVYHHSSSSNNKPESASVIDALEFLSVVVFISEISLEDKIDLLFDSWEMSEDGKKFLQLPIT
jgi:hypothetical protein